LSKSNSDHRRNEYSSHHGRQSVSHARTHAGSCRQFSCNTVDSHCLVWQACNKNMASSRAVLQRAAATALAGRGRWMSAAGGSRFKAMIMLKRKDGITREDFESECMSSLVCGVDGVASMAHVCTHQVMLRLQVACKRRSLTSAAAPYKIPLSYTFILCLAARSRRVLTGAALSVGSHGHSFMPVARELVARCQSWEAGSSLGRSHRSLPFECVVARS
jgi:hypothetical protein